MNFGFKMVLVLINKRFKNITHLTHSDSRYQVSLFSWPQFHPSSPRTSCVTFVAVRVPVTKTEFFRQIFPTINAQETVKVNQQIKSFKQIIVVIKPIYNKISLISNLGTRFVHKRLVSFWDNFNFFHNHQSIL